MLSTARLLLRPWQPADAPALLTLMQQNQSRFARDFPKTLAAVHDLSSAESFIAQKQQEWNARSTLQLGLWQPGETRCLGWLSLKSLEWEVPKAELAYLLADWAEGRGLMREAATAALGWAFTDLHLTRVYCRVNPLNQRSSQLAEKLGFRQEGVLRQDFREGTGQLADVRLYGLLAAEFVVLTGETA